MCFGSKSKSGGASVSTDPTQDPVYQDWYKTRNEAYRRGTGDGTPQQTTGTSLGGELGATGSSTAAKPAGAM